jgi:restriction endonuclease S subunit
LNERLLGKSVPVGSLILSWNRGDGPRNGFYTDDEINGVYFLRVQNLKEHTIDLSEVKYIHRKVHEKTLERAQVTAGDLIFAISGTKDNLGTVSIVPEFIEEANLNSALVRLDLDERKVIQDFFCYFFDLSIAKRQIEFIGKGAAQNNLNNEEISQIKIPLPSLEIQRSLVAEIEVARQIRKQKLDQADKLLSSLDAYLLEQLGLSAPEESDQQVFAVRLSDIGKRFDSHFYHPNFRSVVQTIQETTNVSLGRLVQFSSEIWNNLSFEEEIFAYIEISSINLSSGEVNPTRTNVNEAPSRARMIVRNGDIIVSTTRPHHGAITMIDHELDQCIASTGFAVIRRIIDSRITRIYLWCILRSQLCLRQMRQRSSGGNYPAITEDELKQVLIPVPSIKIQEKIAVEVQERRSKAQRLRQEAETEWEAAKTRFERQLLGEAEL